MRLTIAALCLVVSGCAANAKPEPLPSAPVTPVVIVATITCDNGGKATPQRIEYVNYPMFSANLPQTSALQPHIADVKVFNIPPDRRHYIIGLCGDHAFQTQTTFASRYAAHCPGNVSVILCEVIPST